MFLRSIFFLGSLILFTINISYANPIDLFIPLTTLAKTDQQLDYKITNKAVLDTISKKEKSVEINISALKKHAKALRIDLFGKILTATLDHIEKPSTQAISWVGYIEKKENEVVLVVNNSLIQGNISYQNQQYQIRFKGKLGEKALHILRLVDPKKLRDEHPPNFIKQLKKDLSLQKNSAQSHKITKASTAADSGAFVDVMILWTPTARQEAGGTDAIKALIDLGFVLTNQSYANSGINMRIRLAHKQEINYNESEDIFVNLERLGQANDGYIDNIHALRDTYKADLVSLFVARQGLYCGLAHTPYGSFWDGAAFSVIDYQCVANTNSFAHELGHNLSAMHDWRTDTETSVYPYGHGHLHDGVDSWRTIMSYYKCTGTGPCTRLNYWSNPDKKYNGIAMGIPEGLPQATDNVKALNNAAPFVANYRISGSEPSFTLDIDANGEAKALTDGLLTLRYLFGFTGTSLSDNAIGSGASRNNTTQIQNYLQTALDNGTLDIDGNGETKALTDGLLVVRFLFGFSNSALTDNAIGTGATRNTADIETYLQSKMP